jgi:3-methylfumaryl-CoA hydratase
MTNAAQEQVVRTDICATGAVRRIAAMLDLDPNCFGEGGLLPRGWHFFLLAGDTRRSLLRTDGFPGFGVPIPDLGLPRLMLAGRRVQFNGDLVIGREVHRRSHVAKVTPKKTPSGDIAIVSIHHELSLANDAPPVITEEQTYILLGRAKNRQATDNQATDKKSDTDEGSAKKVIVPDETLLFQYSALGFNSHKIHIDRTYARDVEGLPDLVVNGGLATLLITEFMRVDLGLTPKTMTLKHTAPLYCSRPISLSAQLDAGLWKIKARDERMIVAIDAELTTQ